VAIRAIALSAPAHPSGTIHPAALNSPDPVSLFNALRRAASRAAKGEGPWGQSNWAGSRARRRECCLLMYSMDDRPRLDALLRRERPNIVLIGAMSVCMRGAVECATRIRATMGDDCLIVLGGRHASETLYRGARGRPSVEHHRGSVPRLMESGQIEDVFDIVVGGEAEDVVCRLGIALDAAPFAGRRDRARVLAELADADGDWVAGIVDAGGSIRTLASRRLPIDRNDLPSVGWLFGVSASFGVFDGARTAHLFSDTGPGCAFDCGFCSERRSVTGKPQDVDRAAARLYRQMREARDVIADQHPTAKASAFVEDSILLLGKRSAIADFCALMERQPLGVSFGAQLTIDQILARRDDIRRLRDAGLSYLFIGLETLDPAAIGGMSKDISARRSAWAYRAEAALAFLGSLDIKVGAALLFGLGEPAAARLALFEFVGALRRRYGVPQTLSMNWAVQHPLKGQDGGTGYDYAGWPVIGEQMLGLFHSFGEASTEYPVAGVARPTVREVTDIFQAYRAT
jgi:B12-binding domain/radical SAM domain protein